VKCDEIRKFADLYIDGEFDDREAALFEEHLASCESCHQEVNALLAFQEALRRKLGPPKMPAAARQRVIDAVFVEAPAANRWSMSLPAVVAASVAMLLIGAMGVYRFWPAQDDVSHIVAESVAVHEVGLPLDFEGDGDKVKGFVAEKTDVPSAPPLVENKNTRLMGIRFARVGNSKAIVYKYLHNGRPISVVQLPRQAAEAAYQPGGGVGADALRVLYNGDRNGHSVTLYESPGFTNAVVGDISAPEMRKLIPTSL